MSAQTLTLLSRPAQLDFFKHAAGQLMTLFKERVGERQLAYKTILVAYITILAFCSVKSKLDLPKGPISQDSVLHQPAVQIVRKRSSTWSVSEPTRSWFSAATILGRARSVSAPSAPAASSTRTARARSGSVSVTDATVSARRMSLAQ